MTDCTPKVIVTTNFGLEPHKTIDYVNIMSDAIQISGLNQKVLIYERPGKEIAIPADWIKFDM